MSFGNLRQDRALPVTTGRILNSDVFGNPRGSFHPTTRCRLLPGGSLTNQILQCHHYNLCLFSLFQRIESLYGVTELACWLIRIIINVIEIILIQSLYTMWKDEELLDKRLRDLTLSAIPVPSENMAPLHSQFYQNNGYEHSLEHLNTNLRR